MPASSPLVSAAYLTTEEDYRNYRLAVRRLRVGKASRAAARIAGVLLIAAGAALLYFQSGRIYDEIAWFALILLGMFCASYYDVLLPYLTRREANAQFAVRRRILVAQNMTLYEDRFEVNTDRYTALIPYDMLYKCVDGSSLFLFYTGMDEVRFLPKRVLAEGEAETLSALLAQTLGGRYQKLR